MLNKKIKQKANFGITVIIIIGIIAVINFFSYQIFYRGDLTQNKDYSISKASKQVAGKLDDVVNVKVYFSKNLPSQYISLRQEVGDILDEYAAYSNGKIRVEFIDPGDNEEMKSELYMLGIPELQFNVLEKDKYQIVKGYLGMAAQYGGKTEAIPVVENTDNFEYQVTLAIKKVISDKMAVIGFVTSNAAASLDNEISAAYQKLRELYQARQVDLAGEKEIPDDINTLIIAGPKEKFSEDQLKAIDAF
ncbi:GldG family protein, partial [Patescibacteria group bacterium]|nr:GldG family protein [Patescibacteria group bacterium]